ncbi:substrate-binding periplasmic protein [Piscirickettsia salmonis]|uniref:substrate-binding periplasmic protein n=1 Tax=Piscirickettsia salmonis TaxID=1238 RepID=UPI000F094B9D|nr:ABC transporter substrate-binding protein [Piscirickettsiaceae bacterium NZ-RLO2]
MTCLTRTLFSLFILILIALLSTSLSYSAENIKNTEKIEKLDIYTEIFPPYNYIIYPNKKDPASAQLTGYAVDLLNAVFKRINAPQTISNIKITSWATAYALIQEPKVKNMLFSMTKTKERLALFKWVGPIADHSIVLFTKKNSKINIFSKTDLSNYRYAAIRNDIGALLLANENILSQQIKQYQSFEHIINAINTNQAEIFAYSKQSALYLMRQHKVNPEDYKIIYILKRSPLYYAFNLSVSDTTISIYQQGLDKAKKDKTFIDQLKQKYFQ